MKIVVLLVLMAVSFGTASAQVKDLPGPAANLQTLATGSYVIPMDNTLQANASGYFNLKTYGLIVHLLNNKIKVKWSIKAGKSKDAVDFTAMAEQILPAPIAGGVSTSFKAGPFVISASDTSGLASLINAYYTAHSLTGNNRPKVYRLTASAANVDIRYDMTGFVPKANIMTDGGNQNIHVAYMTNCGVTTSNYRTGPATDLYTKCYTFTSEPHNTVANTATISAIKKFVEYGGNFLAQCAAVETYENSTVGRFHSTQGIAVVNQSLSTALTVYPNADLAYTQYEGAYDIKPGGSVANWTLAAGSSFINNEHNHATGGTLLTQIPIGASVAKLNASQMPGGLVFYLGGHNFSSLTAIESINGIRMYMNAFLTPVGINSGCSVGNNLDFPLPVTLKSFNAQLNTDQSTVNLTWTTNTEINSSHFTIERSVDGRNFIAVETVVAAGNSTEQKNYNASDIISSLQAPVIYYRLRQVDNDNKFDYSPTRMVRVSSNYKTVHILAYPNPVMDKLSIAVPAEWRLKKISCEISNGNGQVLKRWETSRANETENVNVSDLAPGLYYVKVSSTEQTSYQKILKQ